MPTLTAITKVILNKTRIAISLRKQKHAYLSTCISTYIYISLSLSVIPDCHTKRTVINLTNMHGVTYIHLGIVIRMELWFRSQLGIWVSETTKHIKKGKLRTRCARTTIANLTCILCSEVFFVACTRDCAWANVSVSVSRSRNPHLAGTSSLACFVRAGTKRSPNVFRKEKNTKIKTINIGFVGRHFCTVSEYALTRYMYTKGPFIQGVLLLSAFSDLDRDLSSFFLTLSKRHGWERIKSEARMNNAFLFSNKLVPCYLSKAKARKTNSIPEGEES